MNVCDPVSCFLLLWNSVQGLVTIPLCFFLFQDYNEYFRDLDVSIILFAKPKRLLLWEIE